MESNNKEEEEEGKLVLLLRPLFPSFYSTLSQKFRFLKPWESPLPLGEFLSAHARSVRVILCSGPSPVDAETIRSLPRLELVVATGAGVDHVDMDECRRRGIAVTNAGGVFADDSADYAVGLVIDVLRKVSASDRYVRRGLWPASGDYPLGSKVGGKRVGIVGLGNIGGRVAKRLEAFGCIISYFSRRRKSSVSYKYFSNVRDLAAENDVLIASCALTSETHHIIDREVMSALGKEGIIINIGRGALIDEKELVSCLVKGEIWGAGLDVYENEPLVPEELFQLENVVLSRHVAVLTPDSISDMFQLATGNLEAFFSNRELLSPVN
ncbi:putative glyoxylate/hydroxypyruvate reductase HPR3 isoform X2 [Iris pallida]|uniref:Glyoxylate/hydroxypyruvate reductase HPR3 isoform X2 n=1 Tax=Iris pallida TaxID=29817 RepID=A0AAX6GXL4_IRIPA|nr:putative glyoxylate/hydroxypyruvate reductase HPR3 isoform X2 [Iris pallida]KAJ6833671.1 putative glyoxylate/hydroxypyruvate reductase HPR3 isoform X2 [Iris pallida]